MHYYRRVGKRSGVRFNSVITETIVGVAGYINYIWCFHNYIFYSVVYSLDDSYQKLKNESFQEGAGLVLLRAR